MKRWIIFLAVLVLVYLYWRFYWFFRDPDRKIPPGKNIVSPADGKVVYVNKIKKGVVPIAIKRDKKIRLDEIAGEHIHKAPGKVLYHVGIFMTPFNVHVNRTPIAGIVQHMVYHRSNRNLPMTKTWIRVALNIKPYIKGSRYVLRNERNTTLFAGDLPVYVVQIADMYVKKIVSFICKHQEVEKGQRMGLIRMGSQVDVIFPEQTRTGGKVKIAVKAGQNIRAGETIIARY
ncbi:TPA: phosphatidylserine decarboxylase [Candidatus Woesearchaeota archaeon]|nr:MAG: phosphatidylserine decarboxylase [archaeon GW2011_AR16]HIG95914.1 phosphatidylserine decarboxylase [Candidatus Woesearchaeota archaeon]HIH47914.1 phosphatidylserine decarboxylase [Candidatus Woesearchaeota archaeon]HII89341.1 phosphatidylserine decarboxylase [Candidatus Woesearchaeota archaeon]